MGFSFFKKKNNDVQPTAANNAYTMKKLCVFGGTFDPMHRAHLDMALKACRTFSIDRMLFMPSGESYFKTGVSNAEDRLEICKLSVQEYQNLPEVKETLVSCEWEVSDLEIKREGQTYTYETIESLRSMFPDYDIYFLVGEDTLRSMETWKEPQIVFAGCIIIAAARPSRRSQHFDETGHETHDGTNSSDSFTGSYERIEDLQARLMKHYPAEIHIMRFEEDMSSSAIRDGIRSSADLSEKLMPEAYKYIIEKKLYR